MVVRLDEIGDIVLTTPFLRELRSLFPKSEITLIVKPEIYNLVEHCPYVNKIYTFEGKVNGLLSQYKRRFKIFKFAKKYFADKRFDLAILPRWDTDIYDATHLIYLSGAKIRLGYSENVTDDKSIHNKNYNDLLTDSIENIDLFECEHEVMKNLNIIKYIKSKQDGEIVRDMD